MPGNGNQSAGLRVHGAILQARCLTHALNITTVAGWYIVLSILVPVRSSENADRPTRTSTEAAT